MHLDLWGLVHRPLPVLLQQRGEAAAPLDESPVVPLLLLQPEQSAAVGAPRLPELLQRPLRGAPVGLGHAVQLDNDSERKKKRMYLLHACSEHELLCVSCWENNNVSAEIYSRCT